MLDTIISLVAILSIFVLAPGIVFAFIYKSKKNKIELEKLKLQQRMMELELEKEQTHLLALEEENAKYDRLLKD
ncbi:MAG: hypothetical protein LBT11_02955 [Treponema sp.]|jgi:Na+-translocating ferredoxin:NAD+ oxidoreductase RnfG subunit|nr:hypothetical protein [Treponema sp.]